jgi:signal transduction histidine kinase/CheY-like chemotaxis protein/HPt (histidine-containing phosphotransfer) domain-containing protein
MTKPKATSTASTSPDSASPSVAQEIEDTLLSQSFDLLQRSSYLTMCLVPVFLALFYKLFPSNLILLFIGMMLLRFGFASAVLWGWHRRHLDVAGHRQQRNWHQLYAASIIMAALAWTTAPTLMAIQANDAELALLIAVFLTVCAVSLNTQAGQLRAMVIFLTIVLVPPALVCLTRDALAVRMLSAELMGALLLLVLLGRRTHLNLRMQIGDKLRLRDAMERAGNARMQAEAGSQAKSRFLANMSHELRTPLTAVIGAAQLLKTDHNDPKARPELIEAIHQSGTNLLALIENILDISRIEAGELKFEMSDFDLKACVDAAMVTGSVTARAKKLSLASEFEPGLNLWRRADEQRIRQILINLLGNALKFTGTGGVTVRVGQGGRPGYLKISVSDTGVGIPAAALPHIFNPFEQAENQANRRFGGSGLGLSIVHQLVTGMGGEVRASSVEGRGTTVEFELPMPLAQKPVEQAAVPGASNRQRKQAQWLPVAQNAPTGGTGQENRIRVLLVEDDALNRAIVSRLLDQGGMETALAHSGFQALQMVATQVFDVVLMDWQMPGMDGLECTRRLRAGEGGAQGMSVPIISLTANAFAEDRQACLDAGMDDFLTKPVQGERLRSTVQKWAALKPISLAAPLAHEASQKVEAPQSARPQHALSAYDPTVLSKLLGDDHPDPNAAYEIVDLFAKTWPETLESVRRAIVEDDMPALRRQVHTIKSTSASVGAMEMADVITREEERLKAGEAVDTALAHRLTQLFDRFESALARHRAPAHHG